MNIGKPKMIIVNFPIRINNPKLGVLIYIPVRENVMLINSSLSFNLDN